MNIARAVLLVTAIVFAGFGLWLLIYPEAVSTLGVELLNPSARIEIRSFYGGLEIGLGAFLLYCARSPSLELLKAGLLAAGLALGGVSIGRLFGFLVDGQPMPLVLIFTALEVGGALFNLMAWASIRRIGLKT